MGGSSKTTSESGPPAWAAPLFKRSASDALSIYDSGAGGRTFMGSTVAPLSGTTMGGVNQLAQAGANWKTDQTRPIYSQLGASAASNPFIGELNKLAQTAGGETAADKYLTETARGDYLKEGNPYYRQRLDKEIGDSNAMLRSQFSGMGRSGSGVDQRAVAENTSNMLLSGLESDWNRERGNQITATGMMDQARQAAYGTQGNALTNAGGMYSTGIGQGLQAAGAMTNMDQQQFANRLTGADATLKAGGIVDTQAQKQLTDEVNKWYSKDNEPWTRLGLLQAAAGGAAGPYGTQTSRTSQSPGIGQILGGASGLFAGK
jgi:hypothetical protein